MKKQSIEVDCGHNQLKSLLGIETKIQARKGFGPRNHRHNQLKSLLGIETCSAIIALLCSTSHNQLKSLLGIETQGNKTLSLLENCHNQLKSLLGIETNHNHNKTTFSNQPVTINLNPY